MLCLAAGILLIGFSIAANAVARARIQRVEERLEAKIDRLAGYDVVGARGDDAIAIVADAVAERTRRLTPFVEVFAPSLLDALNELLVVAQEQELELQMLSIGVREASVGGVSPNWTASEALKTALEAAGYSVVLQRGDALDDARVPFTLRTAGGDGNE